MISFSSLKLTLAAQPPATSAARTSWFHHHHVCQLSSSSMRLCYHHSHHYCQGLRVRPVNATQPYNHADHLTNHVTQYTKLRICILGFGNYGQFLAMAFIRQGHTVYAHSRSNNHSVAQSMGVGFFSNLDDLCEQHPDVILICTSIISTESVVKSLPLQHLGQNTLFVDVLSVKEFPKNIFLQVLPTHFDILCTHPMFGPESGKNSWQNLPFMFDKVRIGDEDSRLARVENFLNIFKNEGCRMVEMTCAEHDKYAARSQFIMHTIGRILEKLQLDCTPINTKGYETLLDLVKHTTADSFELYCGLFMYNENGMEQLEKLDLAFEALKKELFGHLHEVLGKQLSGKSEEKDTAVNE